ncbi:vWA domain-containing protein [Hyunsoonleella rubra]|uniref:BatA and WFA domain-containing protein n=1 Tax=Hyunsoonleella rubra TaxID=1737062 RepID=A0ABW5TAX3_9FLAO
MQFKYPELLYALFLLLIPIIVHLFQLRKFKKVPFTNVAFLKNVNIQTRKSSQLKKWLTLITRLLLFALIILAFAQPYFSKNDTLNKVQETVIYLDNSFSMQAKGANGPLLKRAIQDIISNIPESQNISIVTNSKTYKNTSVNAVKNELLGLEYESKQPSFNAILLKSKNLFSKDASSIKNLIFISDFQDRSDDFQKERDSSINFYAVKLNPVNTQNVSLDSAYISEVTPTKLELTTIIKNTGNAIDNLPVSLLNDGNIIAKTSTSVDSKATVTFSLPANEAINGEITINDTHLQFDNRLYFNINATDKINVLAIGETDADFLKRIFTEDEFAFTSTSIRSLNYNSISAQNLIILNELKSIPMTLVSVLKTFTDNGGTLQIIPSNDVSIETYNLLLNNYGLGLLKSVSSEKRVTTIHYGHPLYSKGVFEKQVKNFQYPKVNGFYTALNNRGASILSFEDGKPFLISNGNIFLLTASIETENSNFKNSPLIVPTFYNIAKQSFKTPNLYYSIGEQNEYEVKATLKNDGVLSLKNKELNFIPRQQNFNNKVVITTEELPSKAGTYSIVNNGDTFENVSYNYRRTESNLSYTDLGSIEGLNVDSSITAVFDTLKSETKINALWKWFVTFALILLIVEMLILKYFK